MLTIIIVAYPHYSGCIYSVIGILNEKRNAPQYAWRLFIKEDVSPTNGNSMRKYILSFESTNLN